MLRGRAVISASIPLGDIHEDLQQDARRSWREARWFAGYDHT
jgi:hypothetical protein